MIPNRSPWIKQLQRTRPVVPLSESVEADLAIVGGGIAGVVTAFFALRDTNMRVVLLEADKIAHGATGHNAGQITSYFERPLHELAETFGDKLAAEAQRSVESGWLLLDEIIGHARLQTPAYRFTGYAGLSSLPQVIHHLKDNACRVKGGLQTEDMLVAEEWPLRSEIPKEYKELYTLVPGADLRALLETDNQDYIATLSYQKGCMNSALFSEELVGYLASAYKDRFSFYEASLVSKVLLNEDHATLSVHAHSVKVKRVVLCTNGFEHFSIDNAAGEAVDVDFHRTIAGRIGYMAAYTEALEHPPAAISYFPRSRGEVLDPTGESYFYLTRRPALSGSEGGSPKNLITVGGPDRALPNGADYEREASCPEDQKFLIEEFLRENYRSYPKEDPEEMFCWHGLMGYTPTGIRRVGPEPKNPILLYNLGCNGVGILPSLYGGKRISESLNGKTFAPSLFDPHAERWDG